MRQFAKNLVFGHGEQPHKVWFGVGSGCRFIIDPANMSQRIVGLNEAEVGGVFRRCIASSRTFVDVGASDAYYPIIALRLNPTLTAIGCEAQSVLESRAWENYRLNFEAGEPRLEWVAKEVGGGPGQISLDAVAASRPGPVIVKVDVDGGELAVLNSGPQLLARKDCTMLLEVHSEQLEVDCTKLLEANGYQCQVIKTAWWRCMVPEHRPIGWNRWVLAERPAS